MCCGSGNNSCFVCESSARPDCGDYVPTRGALLNMEPRCASYVNLYFLHDIKGADTARLHVDLGDLFTLLRLGCPHMVMC